MNKFDQKRIELITRFQKFIKRISQKDTLVLCFHRDPDGIVSALNVVRALEKFCGKKPDFLFPVDYTDLEELSKALKRINPDKIISVDLGLDSFKKRFEIMVKNCNEMLFIDHHKLYNDFNSEKVIFIKPQFLTQEFDPSQYCVSKLTFDLFSNLVDLSENDWLTCIGILGDRGFEHWKNFFIQVMKERKITLEQLDEATEIVNAVETIKPEKFLELFDFLYTAKNIEDLLHSSFASYRKQLHAEADKFIDSFEEKAEHFPKLQLHILEISPKYNMKSFVGNKLSSKYPEETIVVMQHLEGDDKIWFSARRQDFRVKMNELLEKAIKGIPNASAGGHIPAAAGSIPLKYAERFKQNLKNVLK